MRLRKIPDGHAYLDGCENGNNHRPHAPGNVFVFQQTSIPVQKVST